MPLLVNFNRNILLVINPIAVVRLNVVNEVGLLLALLQ